MKVFYFCTQARVQHFIGTKGKGRLCLLDAEYNWVKQSMLVCVLLCQFITSSAQGSVGDSIHARRSGFHVNQLIMPSVMIAVGSWGVSNGWFCGVKEDVRDGFSDLRAECRFKMDDYLQYLPVLANVGLAFTGAKSRHTFRERLAVTATAYLTMGAIVNATKYTVQEKRPDSNAHNSFPSGHTATAFMGAELVREEYGGISGICAYTFATGIAFLRLYNDRHWLNDIIAGAGVGILSARVGYWLLPWERKLFKWKETSTTISVVPSYNPVANQWGLSLSATL